MKNKVSSCLAALLLSMLSNQVISCDIDTVFSGTLELNTTYDKKWHHEKSFIKKWDKRPHKNIATVVGEIIPIKRSLWLVKDAKDKEIGRIDGDLIFSANNDLCNKEIIKLEHRTNNKYFVTKNNRFIAEINGRLPRIY